MIHCGTSEKSLRNGDWKKRKRRRKSTKKLLKRQRNSERIRRKRDMIQRKMNQVGETDGGGMKEKIDEKRKRTEGGGEEITKRKRIGVEKGERTMRGKKGQRNVSV